MDSQQCMPSYDLRSSVSLVVWSEKNAAEFVWGIYADPV